MPRKYLGYLHKNNTIVLKIISAINRAKFHLSCTSIDKANIFFYIILLWRYHKYLQRRTISFFGTQSTEAHRIIDGTTYITTSNKVNVKGPTFSCRYEVNALKRYRVNALKVPRQRSKLPEAIENQPMWYRRVESESAGPLSGSFAARTDSTKPRRFIYPRGGV